MIKKCCALAMIMAMPFVIGCNDEQKAQAVEPEPVAQAVQAQEEFPSFSTKDLNGNEVTNKIFEGKKLTVVNIWGTFCPPCIDEMPELGKWSKQMSKDVQLIGLVCDVKNAEDSKTINNAKKILKSANADFVNIVPDENLMEYLEEVEAVPTTIFIDSEGRILNKKIIGADVQGYKNFVKSYLK